MREIKYKAWDKKRRKLFEVSELYWSSSEICVYGDGIQDYELLPWDENIVLVQYTGLKDKNGKEIYEGDIAKFNDGVLKEIRIELLDDLFYEIGNYYGNDGESLFGVEVIGNIFENPDSLN